MKIKKSKVVTANTEMPDISQEVSISDDTVLAIDYINSAINVLTNMVANGRAEEKITDAIVNLGVVLVDLKK